MEFITIKNGERFVRLQLDHISAVIDGDGIDGPCIVMTCGTRIHVNAPTMGKILSTLKVQLKGKEIDSPHLSVRYRV